MNFKLWIEANNTASMGININDKHQPFTKQILDGHKTIETRNKPTLNPYVNQKVGIIRTGQGQATLVGYATFGKPKFYKNEKEFNKDYKKHLIDKNSPYYISNNGKWGYPIINPEKTKERTITSKGIVARKI